jgi:hypothetical protein
MSFMAWWQPPQEILSAAFVCWNAGGRLRTILCC